jgi:4-hydroxythreonine-4-phosphate dehydrogenase
VIAITAGDPAGIGPEIIVKALAREPGDYLVIGDARRLREAAEIVGADVEIRTVDGPDDVGGDGIDCLDIGVLDGPLAWGEVSPVAGEAAYRAIVRAVELTREGVPAICTAPLNKAALHAAGHRYPGHTELLAELSDTEEVSMMLATADLRVIHVTTHVGLVDAVERIEPGRVLRTIRRGHDALRRAGIDAPRIAVCGINPHAGEGGLFGHGEEEEKVVPGVEAAVAEGIDAVGPLPADTLFLRARQGDFDLVVAMYHDQGHAPVKVLGLEGGVNITVGLPFVRTSVDHGTAFDIAGTGRADERGMIEALRRAAELVS